MFWSSIDTYQIQEFLEFPFDNWKPAHLMDKAGIDITTTGSKKRIKHLDDMFVRYMVPLYATCDILKEGVVKGDINKSDKLPKIVIDTFNKCTKPYIQELGELQQFITGLSFYEKKVIDKTGIAYLNNLVSLVN